MHVAYALSVHSFVTKIGADLAVAAFIGVALLVIMFFVQARESSLLRQRAEDAEEDLERLRDYAEQVARQAASAQQAAQAARAGQAAAPQPRPGARPTTVPAAAPAGARVAVGTQRLPVAPVGVGAPALSSATRLIPLAEPTPAPSTPAAGSTTAAPAAARAPVAASPAAATPPPFTAAPAAVPPPPRMRTAASDRGGAPERAPRRDYGRGADDDDRGPRTGRGVLAFAAVLVAVIVVAVVLVVTHHSSHARSSVSANRGTTTRASSKTRRSGSHTATEVRVNPKQVRVAVLNGTATNNLAADVSAKLNKVGFQQGESANFSDQTQTSTTVGYLPGNQAQGDAVARALGVSAADVHQISAQALGLVCPSGASACSDQVVVTVGANLDSDAS